MDLYQLLKQDHRKVEEIFKKIAGTTDRAVKTRQNLRARLKTELEIHAQAEEAHFYPALKQHPGTKDKVPEALKEHNEVREALASIERMAPDSAVFLRKVDELKKLVKHHVQEEEREVFPAAKHALDRAEAQGIADRIERMKKDRLRSAAE